VWCFGRILVVLLRVAARTLNTEDRVMPYGSIIFPICCAVFYYRVGEAEYDGGWLLALVSVALWLVGSMVLGLGSLANLLLQVLPFVALTFWNMFRCRRK
jgi:hypothetical protein